jgi:DNA-binding NarL/FixJ family response regulator
MFGARQDCDSIAMPHNTAPIKVFLAEDSPLMRERVGAMLAARAMVIVGYAQTSQACIDGILATHPDVVVLEVQLEGGTGLEVLRTVRKTQPGIEFVVFTINASPAFRKRYLAEGAKRFLDKATEFDQLVSSVERASRTIAS